MSELAAELAGRSGLASGFVPALDAIGAQLAGWLARANLTTGFLLLGALLVNKLCERKVAASLRLMLFAAVFVRLALPQDWSSPLGLLGGRGAAVGTGLVGMSAGDIQLGVAPVVPRIGGGFWIGVVYALGVVLLLGRWMWLRIGLAVQLRRARPAPVVGQLTAGLLGAAHTPVFEHASLGPLVAGVLRPRIVLPSALLQTGDPEALSFVLSHEAAHVARRDHWLMALVQLAAIVGWPVLPLWLAARQIRGLCELACDERVLAGRSGEQRRRYGELLLALSQGQLRLAPAGLSPSFTWDLRTRLLALRRFRRWHRGGQLALVGIGGALLFACSGAPGELPGDPVDPSTLMSAAPAPNPAHGHTGPVLVLDEAGGFSLQGRAIAPAALESELRAALTATGSKTLLIRGAIARLVTTEPVNVMAVAKRAGASSIMAMTTSPIPPVDRHPTQIVDTKAATPARIKGSLDKEIIRAVIQRGIPDVKTCYELALVKQPTLGGRVLTTFTINHAGKVVESEIQESTIADASVGPCIAKAVRGWVFPKPDGGGIVVVTYPFLLTPAGGP